MTVDFPVARLDDPISRAAEELVRFDLPAMPVVGPATTCAA
jgi:hypothetical protein